MSPDDSQDRIPGKRILLSGIFIAVLISLLLGFLLKPRWLDPAYLAERYSYYKTKLFSERETYEKIEICGGGWFREQVKKALSIARKADPERLQKIQSWIGRIQQADAPALLVRESPPTVLLSDRELTFSTEYGLGLIAHFSFHAGLDQQEVPPPENPIAGLLEEKSCDEFALALIRKTQIEASSLKYIEKWGFRSNHGDVNADGKLDGYDYERRKP